MPSFDRVFGSFRSSSKYKDQQPSTNSEGALLFTDGKGEHSAQAIITETVLDSGGKNLSEATQITPERVDVGIAESNPVSLPVTDLAKVQANLDLHREKPETASLEITLARLEQQEKDITQPVYQLNNIKRQITAIKESLAAQSQDKPEVIEETQVAEKVPAMEMHEVLKNVKEVILAEQASAKNKEILNETFSGEKENRELRIKQIKVEIGKLNARMDSIEEKFLDDLIDPSSYKSMS